MANEKVVFYRNKSDKDVVIKVSDYDAKLTCNGKVMYPITELEEGDEKHKPIIEHITMNTWDVYVNDHPTINLHYIDWIGVETNYGFHLIQIGPKKEPKARFALGGGEKITKAYVYCVPKGLFVTIKE